MIAIAGALIFLVFALTIVYLGTRTPHKHAPKH
jgi:hypothetical protein